MSEIIVRPTLKFVYAGYVIILLVVVATDAAATQTGLPRWIDAFPGILLLWPLKNHLQNRLIQMKILNDRLVYETGMLTRNTRTILISRVQDLTVNQRIGQRMFGVGDLSIETAGETSRLTICSIDRPQAIADIINNLSKKGSSPAQQF